VAKSMAAATELPPFTYHGNNADNLPGQPYVWMRNLRANRQYQCPVVYLEPYVMNQHEVYLRIQMGDYIGLRNVSGTMRKSLFREYADSVAQGLAQYYLRIRR